MFQHSRQPLSLGHKEEGNAQEGVQGAAGRGLFEPTQQRNSRKEEANAESAQAVGRKVWCRHGVELAARLDPRYNITTAPVSGNML